MARIEWSPIITEWFPVIYQGTEFSETITYVDSDGNAVDLTDYSIIWEAWERQTSETSLFTAWTVTGEIVKTDPTNGVFTITLSGETTDSLDFFNGYHTLDIIRNSDSERIRIREGEVLLSRVGS